MCRGVKGLAAITLGPRTRCIPPPSWKQIHLLGLQHSEAFIGEELAGYLEHLSRHAEALRSMESRPACAWLVALRSGEWTPFPVDYST